MTERSRGSRATAAGAAGAAVRVAVVVVAAVAALAAVLVAAAPAAWADDADDAPVAWSVAPAGPDGPDGRHWVELGLKPGDRVEDHFAVKNLSRRAAVFQIQAADGLFTAQGRFNMLDRPEESVDAGAWIDVVPNIEVGPGETVVVPFTVTVPAEAEPGDHAAGIAAALTRSSSLADGSDAGVGVVSRFGFRVMVRVEGELRPGLEIRNMETAYDMSWNPFEPGQLWVSFDLANTGNTRLVVTGQVNATYARDPAAYPAADGASIELLPGDTRRVAVEVRGVWPLFAVKAEVSAVPQVVALEGAGEPPALAPLSASTTVLAPPWPQLAVLAGLALVASGWLAGRRRSARRLARLLEQARAEERARLGAGLGAENIGLGRPGHAGAQPAREAPVERWPGGGLPSEETPAPDRAEPDGGVS
ncbi:MAG: hypothetical protein LBD97_08915 [Bifidobacteriaceae bacterium]|jgi:hypothetical protein|nr:hypothetical protein [Bifidobacteriaceae bacterium]